MATLEQNIREFAVAFDIQVSKAKDIQLNHYRAAVWAVFEQLVYTTPQYSGKAAANWNIGINAPDYSFDDGMGDKDETTVNKKTGWTRVDSVNPRHTGDNKWAEESLARNRIKKLKISKNFVCNCRKENAPKV